MSGFLSVLFLFEDTGGLPTPEYRQDKDFRVGLFRPVIEGSDQGTKSGIKSGTKSTVYRSSVGTAMPRRQQGNDPQSDETAFRLPAEHRPRSGRRVDADKGITP